MNRNTRASQNIIPESVWVRASLYAAQHGTLVETCDIDDGNDPEVGPVVSGGITYEIRCGGIRLLGDIVRDPNCWNRPIGFLITEIYITQRRAHRRYIRKASKRPLTVEPYTEADCTPCYLTLDPAVNKTGSTHAGRVGSACGIVPLPKRSRRSFWQLDPCTMQNYRDTLERLNECQRWLRTNRCTSARERRNYLADRLLLNLARSERIAMTRLERKQKELLRRVRQQVLKEVEY